MVKDLNTIILFSEIFKKTNTILVNTLPSSSPVMAIRREDLGLSSSVKDAKKELSCASGKQRRKAQATPAVTVMI